MAHGRTRRAGPVLVAVVLTTTVLGGCLSSSGAQLIQTGSSTVLPMAIVWAEEFDGADISVSGGGSSHGFNALLNVEADLADASRLLKGSDYEKVGGDPSWVEEDGTANRAVNGILPVKWEVAYDVLAVIINKDNDWTARLNFSQLHSIFTDDPDRADHWDEVPGLDDAPHRAIEIYAPDEASGTYDYFFESIVPDWGKEGQAAGSRLSSGDGVYHPNADDNVIITAISDNRYAIGFIGFAYLAENPGRVGTVAIAEGEGEAVPPVRERVSDYPLARPLYIYTNKVPLPGDVVNDYLRFVLSDEGQAFVPEVGYVPLGQVDPDLLEAQLTLLEG